VKKLIGIMVAVGVLALAGCISPLEPINAIITAAFEWVISASNSRTVLFDASESVSAFGDIAFYEWDFGDGATVILGDKEVTHAYATWGTWEATLTVTDGAGNTAETMHDIDLEPTPPVARFSKTADEAVPAGAKVTFDASTSEHVDGEIVSAKWWFGDGNGIEGLWATMMVIQHTYVQTDSQRYTVTLEVTDVNGLMDTRTRRIGVVSP